MEPSTRQEDEMAVRCGFAKQMHPDQDGHDTISQVRACAQAYYERQQIEADRRDDMAAERAAELAYERHLEDRGYYEARLQEEMERRQGVIPFDEALRDAEEADEAVRAQVEAADGPRRVHPDPDVTLAVRPLTRAMLATIPVHEDTGHGHYAIRNETGEVELYQIERPTEGAAAGSTFVRPYGERTNLRGSERARVFAAILADPLGAAALFGRTTGKCGLCHHPMWVKESLERVVVVNGRKVTGVGPKCAKKFRRAA
jgi:hypothetical protein